MHRQERRPKDETRYITVGSILENLQFVSYYLSFLFKTSIILIYVKINHWQENLKSWHSTYQTCQNCSESLEA